MTHDPYRVEPRKHLTAKQRMELFVRHGGVCCICGGKIDGVRERWIDEHKSPLWRDGTNDQENRAPAHERCAKIKTADEATARSKGREVAEKHFGARKAAGFRRPKGAKFDWAKGRYVRTADE